MGERRSAGAEGVPLSRFRRLWREIAKFGAVGAIGFLVNVAVFNLCIHTLSMAPVRSGVIAQVVAIGTNYLGNRFWTYRDTDKSRLRRETTLFFLFSGLAMIIENAVLALSHYGFGFTSPLSDNIAKNVVGLGLGTVFRFWCYRTWVFNAASGGPAEAGEGPERAAPAAEAPAAPERTAAGVRAARARRRLTARTARSGRLVTRAGRRSRRGVRVGGLAPQEEGEDRGMLLK